MININFLFGKMDIIFKTFLIIIIIDYITGILKAIYLHKLNSEIGIKGIIKKIGYLLIIIVAELIDTLHGSSFNIRDIILYMFISNEIISILENINTIGIKIPKQIKNMLLNGGENNKSDS